MPSVPTKTLLAVTCVVGASTAALPQVAGYGTVLFQFVVLGAWFIVARISSDRYADAHHPVMWSVSLALNLLLFLIPASGIWLASRKQWPVGCSIALLGWCLMYLASLFWLFPATDGP